MPPQIPLKIVMLGSGNVATHLVRHFFEKGHNISQVYSRTISNAELLARKTGATAIHSLSEIKEDADLLVLALSDDAIPKAAEQLRYHNALIVHTSGSTEMDVLTNKRKGVFYPLQSFSKHRASDFKNIPILIEASSNEDLLMLKELGASLSEQVVVVNSEKRAVAHLAAVFACNFVNYLYQVADSMLASNALSFDLLRPLIMETAEKVMANNPALMQTGPAVRNDTIIIGKHLRILNDRADLSGIYDMITQNIIKENINKK